MVLKLEFSDDFLEHLVPIPLLVQSINLWSIIPSRMKT